MSITNLIIIIYHFNIKLKKQDNDSNIYLKADILITIITSYWGSGFHPIQIEILDIKDLLCIISNFHDWELFVMDY